MASNVWKCFSLIAVDLLVTFSLHGATKLMPLNSTSACLSHLCILAGIRWLFLGVVFSVCLDTKSKVILQRFATTTCLLCPVFETGAMVLLGRLPENWSGCFSSPGKTVIATIATAIACLFWEVNFPDGVGKVQHGSKETEKKQKALALFLRVIRYSRPDAPFLSGAFLFLALAVICEMFIPFYTGKVIDILGTHYQASEFQNAILFMGLFSLGSSLSSGLRGGLFMCTLSRLNKRVRLMLFQALIKQEIGFFENTKTGDLTSRLSTDTKLMSQSVAMNVNILLRGVIKTVGVLILMVNLSWRLTLVTFIEAPLIAIIQKVYNLYYEHLSKEVQDSMALANEVAKEAVAAMRTVRSFRSENSESCRYNDQLIEIHRLKTQRDTVRAVYLLVRRLMALGIQVLILHYGRQLIAEGQMTTGNLVSFILYQGDLGSYVMTVVYMFSNMLNSVGAAAKVFEYLDREPLVSTKGTLEPDHLTGHVQFQNLTFSYPSRPDTPALKDFSLELLPGKLTALVGLSGGGKSTCVNLLERFYHSEQGEILLDGKPLHCYEHRYLHRKVAMVGQEPVLFAGSVRDNIAYGLEDCPLEKVQEAARMANAHHFICQMENGYNTDVGEGGGQLSGGQKQRIAIARALIRDPQVLILDEVTSALDTESEHMIQQALASYPSRTLLVIAHRLKTIEEADQIVVIGEGKVQEQGTHQELMDRKGTYYKLRQMTFTKVKGVPVQEEE